MAYFSTTFSNMDESQTGFFTECGEVLDMY